MGYQSVTFVLVALSVILADQTWAFLGACIGLNLLLVLYTLTHTRLFGVPAACLPSIVVLRATGYMFATWAALVAMLE